MLNHITVFVQARTSSKRFPRKVLRKIGKLSVLEHVTKNLRKSKLKDIVVLTSLSKSDDAIIKICQKNKLKYFRGELNNVSNRYYAALKNYKPPFFARISADSPFISPEVINLMLNEVDIKYDIVTNTYKRSFPKGQSVEIIKTKTYRENIKNFVKKDLEHVTSYFYRNKIKFKIKNVSSRKNLSKVNLSIDNKIDYERAKFIYKKLFNNKLEEILNLYFQYEKN